MSKSIPIHCLVAIGYPSTIVETTPGNRHIFQKVLHAEHIPNKVLDLAKTAPSPSLTTYQLIQDHILLHGSITNEQCRKLLGLSSIHTSTRLLLSMNLPFQGSTQDRVYTK